MDGWREKEESDRCVHKNMEAIDSARRDEKSDKCIWYLIRVNKQKHHKK